MPTLFGPPAVLLGALLLAPSPAYAAQADSQSVSTGDAILLAVAGIVLAAMAFAGAEIYVKRLSRRHHPELGQLSPGLSSGHAQRLYEHSLYVVAPAVVATAISLLHDHSLAHGLAVMITFVFAGVYFWPDRSPLHLMPVARNAVRLLIPLVGTGLVLAPGLFSIWDIQPDAMGAPLLGAELIVLLGLFLETSFDRGSPVRLAVLGSPGLTDRLAVEMRLTNVRTFKVVGYLTADESSPGGDVKERGVPWLGSLEDIREIVLRDGIDLLAIGPDQPRLHVFEEAAKACLDLPVRMVETSALYEDVLGHVPIGAINSAWFQCIMHPRYTPTSSVTKRAIDLLIAVPAAVLVALPLTPLIALAIKLGDRGPVFYRQRRVGEQGVEFDILKFRTMRPGSRKLAGLVPKDKLITPVGRLLRKTHLDELPQLFNVLKGDMTVVGPRPEQPDLVEGLSQLVPYYERRALVKPGVTGWAQIRCGYAGTQVGTAWKMCHDLFYVKHRTVVFDLLIMLQTVQTLLKASEEELEAPHEEFILGEAASLVGRASTG